MFNTFSKLLISFSTVLPNDFIAFVFKDNFTLHSPLNLDLVTLYIFISI